jgi:hypothetical protein
VERLRAQLAERRAPGSATRSSPPRSPPPAPAPCSSRCAVDMASSPTAMRGRDARRSSWRRRPLSTRACCGPSSRPSRTCSTTSSCRSPRALHEVLAVRGDVAVTVERAEDP